MKPYREMSRVDTELKWIVSWNVPVISRGDKIAFSRGVNVGLCCHKFM